MAQLSHSLFSLYIDGLIRLLRKSGIGCRINAQYYGVLGYADDLLLLSASRSGLQAMVSICETFSVSKKLKFSTNEDPNKSKTKCIIFSKTKIIKENIASIMLNKNPLPWVDEVKHLGNILQSDNSMSKDCTIKRGQFIGKVNALMQELHFVGPSTMMRLLNIYVCSFYGSCLWNLFSKEVLKIFSSWNVTVRNVFNLPRNTHRYLIESVSNMQHPKMMLCSRYIKFMDSLVKCNKRCVRNLALLVRNDRRTIVGKNISNIAYDCGVVRESLQYRDAKRSKYWSVPALERWRPSILLELLDVRSQKSVVRNFDYEEINLMINNVCSS